MRAPRAVLVLCGLACAVAGAAHAQENPALQEAVRLAGEGRGDDARRLVNAELTKARAGDPAYVEALYFRARLTTSGDSAERDLRRVAIEFPTSRWADDAVLQLAQLAMAAGNPVSAFALAERLRSDYPDSDLRPRAAYWAGRAAFDLGDPRGGCALLDSARAEGAADIEFTNQVAFYRGRCAALPPTPAPTAPQPSAAPAPAQPDTTRAAQPAPAVVPAAAPQPATPPRADAPAAGGAGPFTIQVAAVKTDADMRRIVRRLSAAGFEAHLVTGADRFRRIRVGAYRTEAEAQGAIARLHGLVGGHPFVVRER